MSLYAYTVRLSKTEGHNVIVGSTLGWGEFQSEDEARGRAAANALDMRPGFSINDILVMEINGWVREPEAA